MRELAPFPEGIKVGDFVQSINHFGDVFFEVVSAWKDKDTDHYWHVWFVRYGKYDAVPSRDLLNAATAVRQVVSAEMAVPVMQFKGQRFHAKSGHYDPFYGFAPVGTPLRRKSLTTA